jgi:hypothetical protein
MSKSEKKPTVKKETKAESQSYTQERAHFNSLLMTNPNYFGNLKVSNFESVVNIQSNTTYEEIGCVGFQPQFNRLEAVVYVKQPSGYGGNICSNGSQEYVRFYLSFDHGATWQDQGLTSFAAYDVPDLQQRLEYAVSLHVNPPKKFCFNSNVVLCRAILSWNVAPPANTPGYTPVWGEVHNTHIQVDPFKFFILGDLFKEMKLKITPQLKTAVDLSQTVKVSEKPALSLTEKHALYQRKDVPAHRFAFAEAQSLLEPTNAAMTATAASNYAVSPEIFASLNIDLQDLVAKLQNTDGSTYYEEMECIGYNPNLDTLVGTIRIKRPDGYSGGLCSSGSREYVTFWADLNGNGTFETCIGTTSVNVHDIDEMPSEGLEYAVFLPANLSQYRQPCQYGPRLIRIRAIMSWQTPAPCWNPNYVPTWGNREETLICLKPGLQPQGHAPIIQTVGSMDVDDINPITGLASGTAALAGFTAQDSPFGGLAVITGHIANTADLSAGATALKYKVEIRSSGGPWEPVANSFELGRDQLLNGVWGNLPDVTQAVDGDGWYTYQEDLVGGPGNAQIFPVGNVLARWQTAGRSGLHQIRILAKDPANPGPMWVSNVVAVFLKQNAPVANIAITSGGGNCADFNIGDVISGTYSVTDTHFSSLRLSLAPPNGGSFISPAPLPASGGTMPLTRTYAAGVSTNGEAGTWSLDTSGLPRCGYVVYLHAWDRTIVNSGFIGHHGQDVVGLCLRDVPVN